jgi:four helix bundle protein
MALSSPAHRGRRVRTDDFRKEGLRRVDPTEQVDGRVNLRTDDFRKEGWGEQVSGVRYQGRCGIEDGTRMTVRSYRDLVVWQKAMDVTVECDCVTKLLPKSEGYGSVSQIQRAAESVPVSIAEGHGREPLGDYLRHLSVANGSLMELETHTCCSRVAWRMSQ